MIALSEMTPEEALKRLPPAEFWQAWEDCPGGLAYWEMFSAELKRRIFRDWAMTVSLTKMKNDPTAGELARIVADTVLGQASESEAK